MTSLAARDGRANIIRAFKATGCKVCGVRYPEVDWSELHADHIDPSDKALYINDAGRRGSAAELLAELLKCQVLCTRHHLAKTRNGSGRVVGQLFLFNGSGEAWRIAEVGYDDGKDIDW